MFGVTSALDFLNDVDAGTWLRSIAGKTVRQEPPKRYKLGRMKCCRAILIPALVFLAIASIAQSGVLGTWKGKISIDMTKMPKMEAAEKAKVEEQMKAVLSKMVMTLVFKADKTFTVTVKNLPGKTGDQSAGGTWKQTGNKIAMTTTTENGKPAKKKEVQTLIVSPDGKKLTMQMPELNGMGSVTFVR